MFTSRSSVRTRALAVCLASWALATPAQTHDAHAHAATAEQLGTVHFESSCAPAVQPGIDRAVALMHSFQFGPAIQGFEAVLAGDPSCAIAGWGIALSRWGNPFAANLKTPAQVAQGLQAVDQGLARAPKTPRERAWLDAVGNLYRDAAGRDQPARMRAYAEAMASVRAAWPDDVEAEIFHALALAAAADPADRGHADLLKAGALLEPLFAKYPDHPGLAHYIVHTYDVPELAGRAAEAARRYSAIAPSTPHALHMPSHTFTRTGDWPASIATNRASAASARAAGQPADEMHASDYMVYAYLQTGQDRAARELAGAAARVFAGFDPSAATTGASGPLPAFFARAAIPARVCLELRDWACALRLEKRPSPFPYIDAITDFAVGLGAARTRDTATAQARLDALQQARDTLDPAGERYWANQVEVQRREVAGWLAWADGRTPEALTTLREAADMEDRTEKNAVTPGPLAPARELLGDLLLELDQPAEALVQYEATLAREPDRFRALHGAAEAARRAGRTEVARRYLDRLLVVASAGDRPGRAPLVEARRRKAS